MQMCLILNSLKWSPAAIPFFLSGVFFCPLEPIKLTLTCNPLPIVFYLLLNVSYDNNFVSFLIQIFSHSALFFTVVMNASNICIIIAPPVSSLKLLLAVMAREDVCCAKSCVHLADKTVALYILSITILCHLSPS